MSKPIMVMLAKQYDGTNPRGWWMSEKLDGVRAYWTGSEFLTRNGNTIQAPAWFAAGLPSTALDGELWMGRGKFQTVVGVVRCVIPDDRWTNVQFLVFDAPDVPGTFEVRNAWLADFASVAPAHVRIVSQTQCKGQEHLSQQLAGIVSTGGEGIMLRKPGSSYDRHRSSSLLKMKPINDDTGEVIGYQPGLGRNAGRVGALILRLNGKTTVEVGTGLTDEDRNNPPAIGDRVNFLFNGLTDAGVPRFPVFSGVRAD